MTTITTRAGKGSPLLNSEVDANFTNLNDDKVEASGDSITGDLSFGDNNKAIFGAGSDLKIYHDGSDSYIDDTGTGRLRLRGAADIILAHPTNGETYAVFSANGANTFYYDNAAKLATTSTGIDVTGNTESDTVTIGIGSVAGSEKLRVNGTVLTLGGSVSAPAIGIGDTNTGVYAPTAGQLGWTVNGTQRLFLDSTGIDVTGTVTADGLAVDGNVVLGGPGDEVLVATNTNLDPFYIGRGYVTTETLAIGVDDSDAIINSIQDERYGGYKFQSTYSGTGTRTRMQIGQNTGDISFYDDAGTTQAFYWDASTSRLGLGTTSPYRTLTVSGDQVVEGLLEVTAATPQILFSVPSGGLDSRIHNDGSGNFIFGTGTNSATPTERMRIDSSGRVGIGTQSPAEELHINASVPTIRLQDSDGTNQYSNIIHSNGLLFFYARSGSINGTFNFVGDDGTTQSTFSQITENAIQQFHSSAWYIRNRVDGGSLNFGVETTAGSLYYPVQMNGTSDILVFNNAEGEMARFDTNGRMLVGKTSQVYTTVGVQLGNYSSNSIDNTTQFTHNNSGGTSVACTAPVSESCITFHRQDTGAFMGHIRNDSSNSVSYFTSSDERLKENIVDAPSASDDIDAIQIRSFDWKADGSHQKYGVIAQELNNVMPSAVDMTQDENRHASVDLSKLVPMLVKEIQSLRARVAQLEGAN